MPCFHLRVLITGHEIWIPVASVARCRLRNLSQVAEAERALAVFDTAPPDYKGVSWIQRSRAYEDSLSGGQLDQVIVVYRDLLLMKQRGPLSFGQIRLLERARRMVICEIALVLELDDGTLADDMERRFHDIQTAA